MAVFRLDRCAILENPDVLEGRLWGADVRIVSERKQQKKGGDAIAANPDNEGADACIKCRRNGRTGSKTRSYCCEQLTKISIGRNR